MRDRYFWECQYNKDFYDKYTLKNYDLNCVNEWEERLYGDLIERLDLEDFRIYWIMGPAAFSRNAGVRVSHLYLFALIITLKWKIVESWAMF
jgi:hypothetical protein